MFGSWQYWSTICSLPTAFVFFVFALIYRGSSEYQKLFLEFLHKKKLENTGLKYSKLNRQLLQSFRETSVTYVKNFLTANSVLSNTNVLKKLRYALLWDITKAYSGNSVPTFRENLSATSPKVKKSKKESER